MTSPPKPGVTSDPGVLLTLGERWSIVAEGIAQIVAVLFVLWMLVRL